MPNRIIKESICTSESIDSLSWFEEVFFYRLIVNCDDYGLMDARTKVLKAKLFPLKDRVTVKEITDALVKLAAAGCIQLYEVENKPFLQLTTWGDHQRIRNKKTKYPEPNYDSLHTLVGGSRSLDSNLLTNDGPPARVYENPIQSESEVESESKRGGDLFSVFERCGFQITGHAAEELMALSEECSEAWVIEAIRRASDQGKRTLAYVKGILRRWQVAGAIDDVKRPLEKKTAEGREIDDTELDC